MDMWISTISNFPSSHLVCTIENRVKFCKTPTTPLSRASELHDTVNKMFGGSSNSIKSQAEEEDDLYEGFEKKPVGVLDVWTAMSRILILDLVGNGCCVSTNAGPIHKASAADFEWKGQCQFNGSEIGDRKTTVLL
jgi:hypothetical protein